MSKVTTEWVTKLTDGVSAPAEAITKAGQQAAEAIDGIGGSADSAAAKMKTLSAIDLRASADAIRDLTAQFQDVMKPGMAFEEQMKEMQSVTRLSDAAMESLGDSARKTANAYGNDAAAQLGSYSALIARFGPDVAKSSDALAVMGEDIAILSKLMGGDAAGSMDALTTAMLQFGVDLSDPMTASAEMTRMMNVMAAAGNEGASEVADTAEALKNAGVAAKNANLTFEETNAAIQALAQGGRVGAEAGVSLRNVLGKMGGIDIIPRRAQEKIRALGIDFDVVSNKSLPLADRLRELSKAQGDATLIAQIFGIENEAAANILLGSIGAQEDMTKAISGTNAANESADIIMDSTAEKLKQFTSWLDNLKISFYNVAGGILPFVVGLGTVAFTVANMASAVTGIKSLIAVTKAMTVTQWSLNFAFLANPITWIVLGVAALVAAVVLCWNKFEGFRKVVLGVWEVIKGFGKILKDFVIDRIKGIISGLGAIGEAIMKLFKGDFKGGWESAKQGVADLSGYTAIKNAAQSTKELYQEGAQKGAESWARSQAKKKEKEDNPTPVAGGLTPLAAFQTPAVATPTTGTPESSTGGGTSSKAPALATSGGGGGGGKTVNMTVNMVFNGFKGTREMADEVARVINGRLSDSLSIA